MQLAWTVVNGQVLEELKLGDGAVPQKSEHTKKAAAGHLNPKVVIFNPQQTGAFVEKGF